MPLSKAISLVEEFLVAKDINVSMQFCELTPTNDMPQLLAIMKQHAEYALRKSQTGDIRMLALSLVIEETAELIEAVLNADELDTMDAIGDCVYVILGLALRLRLPANGAFIAVHESNMTKAPGSPDQPRLDGEKKGESYVAPNFDRATSVGDNT